jgi:hypothetical protein
MSTKITVSGFSLYLLTWDLSRSMVHNLFQLANLNAEKLKQIPLKPLRPIGEGYQELEKRLVQEELT